MHFFWATQSISVSQAASSDNFQFIPVLEQMSMALVAKIELLSITCEQSSHDGGNRNHASSKKKMGVLVINAHAKQAVPVSTRILLNRSIKFP